MPTPENIIINKIQQHIHNLKNKIDKNLEISNNQSTFEITNTETIQFHVKHQKLNKMANTNKPTKSRKQEVLDSNPTNTTEWTLQQMCLQSKTELESIRRQLTKLNNICYKTDSKNLSVTTLLGIILTALEYIKEEENGQSTNKVEN